MTPLKIICAFFVVLAVSYLLRCFMTAEEIKVTNPDELMSDEECEALRTKARQQREMHQLGRDLRGKIETRINQ